MTGEAESQNEYEDSGLPGPGAPTPLAALEVSCHSSPIDIVEDVELWLI